MLSPKCSSTFERSSRDAESPNSCDLCAAIIVVIDSLAVNVAAPQPCNAPLDMLKSSVFWLLYIMFVLVAGSGLMATAQIAPIAVDFKLADREVTGLFVAATTLSVALVFDNVLNGLARPFFGWISDIIGRENTMAIVFSLGALAYWGLGEVGHTPYVFIIMTGLIFSPEVRYSACFRRRAPTPSARNTLQLMPGCSTPRKAQQPGLCR